MYEAFLVFVFNTIYYTNKKRYTRIIYNRNINLPVIFIQILNQGKQIKPFGQYFEPLAKSAKVTSPCSGPQSY